MLTDKEIETILNDLGKILGHDVIVHDRADNAHEWIDITLQPNLELTSNDFPHLLTIAENYGLHISIYVYGLKQLGIFLRR